MENNLSGKKVAIVVTDGFEESEFTVPLEALKDAGASIDVISLKPGTVRSWTNKNWGKEFTVDKNIGEVDAHEYNALVLPGGVMNSDKLRMSQEVVNFVGGFFEDDKP